MGRKGEDNKQSPGEPLSLTSDTKEPAHALGFETWALPRLGAGVKTHIPTQDPKTHCTAKPLAGHTLQSRTQPQRRGCPGLQHPYGTFAARRARPPPDVTACPRAPRARPRAERGAGWRRLSDLLSQQRRSRAQPPHPCSSHGQVRTLAKPSARWQPAPSGSLSAIKPEWVFPPPPDTSSSFWGYCF